MGTAQGLQHAPTHPPRTSLPLRMSHDDCNLKIPLTGNLQGSPECKQAELKLFQFRVLIPGTGFRAFACMHARVSLRNEKKQVFV